jgi:hypothetical protein
MKLSWLGYHINISGYPLLPVLPVKGHFSLHIPAREISVTVGHVFNLLVKPFT